jgi:hypothetical protein
MLRVERKTTRSATRDHRAAVDWLIATTRAIFFVIGITQPLPQEEAKTAVYFWSAVLAIACLSALAVALVVHAVSVL